MHNLNYKVDGPEDAPVMCFLHGWPDSPELWRKQIPKFSAGYRCIRFELPNYGDTIEPFYSFEEVTDLIVATIEKILATSKEKRIVLVGHDWGAFFAYLVEATRPDLVQRLVTMDVGAYLKPESLLQALAIVAYQWALIAAFYTGRLVPALGNLFTKTTAHVIGTPKSSNPRWQMNYLYVNYWSGYLHGKAVGTKSLPKAPLLYFYGRRKPFMFHMQSWLDQVQANAKNKVVEMKQSGHWLMLDEADQVNLSMQEWLRDGQG